MIRPDLDTAFSEAPFQRERLVLAVGPQDALSPALRAFAKRHALSYLDLRDHLVPALAIIPETHRPLRVGPTLRDLLPQGAAVIDGLGPLFSPSLRIKPLATLKGLARDRSLVVGWPGRLDGPAVTDAPPPHRVVFGAPGQPAFRREDASDLLVVPID